MVDFVFDRGLFHVVVANLSAVPALRVSVAFDKPFHGLGGRVEISALRLFRHLEFLAPWKRIETFLDSSAAYFLRREPTRITALICFRDTHRRRYERHITHDLTIYKDLAYLVPAAGATSPVVSNSASASGAAHPMSGEQTYGHL